MCIDTDLFGDIIVLKSDVLLWLDTNPIMQGRSKSQREYYVKTFDVLNKIKLAKLSGLFYKVISEYQARQNYDDETLDCLQTRHVKDLDEKKPACASWFHICNNFDCVVFKQRIKRDKTRAKNLKRKN